MTCVEGGDTYADKMRAELKSIYAPDFDLALHEVVPPDPDNFDIYVRALIGPEGSIGEESLDFMVCSPLGLAARKRDGGYEFLRGTLVLDRWDGRVVEDAIADLCVRTEAETWSQVGDALSRYGHWEFEDYH